MAHTEDLFRDLGDGCRAVSRVPSTLQGTSGSVIAGEGADHPHAIFRPHPLSLRDIERLALIVEATCRLPRPGECGQTTAHAMRLRRPSTRRTQQR